MKCKGLWYGGCSYCPGSYEDIEEFSSIQRAKDTFIDRYKNWDNSTPCVDETSEMWLFLGKEPIEGELYPDCIISIGPRGGVRVVPV